MPHAKIYEVIKLRDIITVPDPPPKGKIILPVVHRNALLFWYRADAHAPFKDLMLLSELYTRVDYTAFTFICNRRVIKEHHTPAELNLFHGDAVLLRLDPRFRKISSADFSPAIAK